MSAPHTIARALDQAKALGLARLDAQQLLSHLLQKSRTWVITHADEAMPAALIDDWHTQLSRRAAGTPLAYLLGFKEFYGIALDVSADVLVPRPETETLVDWALSCLRGGVTQPRVLDLGTGSGAIALAVQQAYMSAQVWATDASAPALIVAQNNAKRLHLPIKFALGDWWQAVCGLRFDLILSNPPYIAEGDPHLDALQHEPAQALTSGPEGLNALRHLIAHAPAHLTEGGWLLMEHGYNQANAVTQGLQMKGFRAIETRHDLANLPRCTGGQWLSAITSTSKPQAPSP